MTILANQKAELSLLASIGEGINHILQNQYAAATSDNPAVLAAITKLSADVDAIKAAIGEEAAPVEPAPVEPSPEPAQ